MSATEEGRDEVSSLYIRVWLLLAAALLVFKYAGILVSAVTTSKVDNLIEGVWVTSKLFDMSINFMFFVLFGWALASGKGDGYMFAGTSQFACTGIAAEGGGWATVLLLYMLSAIFLIIVTETMRSALLPLHLPYQIITFAITSVIFPVVVHWAWSDHGWASAYRSSNFDGLLFGCGVLDTAGSGVVHFGGGLTALAFAAATATGTEWIEKFAENFKNEYMGIGDENGDTAGREGGAEQAMRDDDEVLKRLKDFKESTASTYNQGVGIMLFWIGAYGMIIINLPVDTENASASIALRAINVTMAAAASCVAAVVMQIIRLRARSLETVDEVTSKKKQKRRERERGVSIDVADALGAVYAALISIGGSCATCELGGAAVIGIVAAIIHHSVKELQAHLMVNRRTGAINQHLAGGLWGLIAPGFFASKSNYAILMGTAFTASELGGSAGQGRYYTTYDADTSTISLTVTSRSDYCAGLFYGGSGAQLAANLVFALALLAWCYVMTFVVVKVIKVANPDDFAAFKVITAEKDHEELEEIRKNEDSWLYKKLFGESADRMGRQMSHSEKKKEEEDADRGQTRAALLRKSGKNVSGRMKEADELFVDTYKYSWDAVMVLPMHNRSDRKRALMAHGSKKYSGDSDKAKEQRNSINFTALLASDIPEVDPSIPSARDIIKALREKGLETMQYYGSTFDDIYVKVRAPLHVLRRQADLMDLPMKLDPLVLQKSCKSGFSGNHGGKNVTINSFDIYDGFEQGLMPADMPPYQYIYGRMDDIIISQNKAIYEKAPGLPHEFGVINRLRVIDTIVKGLKYTKGYDKRDGDESDGGEDEDGEGDDSSSKDPGEDDGKDAKSFSFDKLHNHQDPEHIGIKAWFPLHDDRDIAHLQISTFNVRVADESQGKDDIRDYLGSEVGLYFKFLGSYIKYLVPISVLGLGASIQIYALWAEYQNYFDAINNSYSVPIFSLIVCIWTAAFLLNWTAEEKYNAMRWGNTNFEETEEELPNYLGDRGKSIIDGSSVKLVNKERQNSRRRVSALVITTLSLLVLGIIAITFYFKYWLIINAMSDYSVFADIMNAISIGVLDFVYKIVAQKMTNFENHRTQTEVNDAMIVKLFVFSFFNSYAPAIYIAFIKKAVNDTCNSDSCMGELGQSMAIIFTVRSLSIHVITFVVPRAQKIMADWSSWWAGFMTPDAAQVASIGGVVSDAEEEFRRPRFENVFQDYNELSVQFGFLSLFSAAFPIAPILALINNYIEVRSDGLKLLLSFRRPWPVGAEDIGSWYTIFDIIGVLSIFSNAGIISWTMDLMGENMAGSSRLAIFIVFVLIALLGRQITSQLLRPVKLDYVNIQLARQDYIVKKVIDRVPDEIEYNTSSGGVSKKNADYYSSDIHGVFTSPDETTIAVLEEKKKDK